MEEIKHSCAGWKKCQGGQENKYPEKAQSQEVRVEEFDTREKEKCRAAGGVFMIGRFPIEGKSGLVKGKLDERESTGQEACS